MKKIVIGIFSAILVFMTFGCAKREEQPIYSSQNTSSEIANEHNSANVQYREVKTLIEDALNEIGIYDEPENIDIQSEETVMISADINLLKWLEINIVRKYLPVRCTTIKMSLISLSDLCAERVLMVNGRNHSIH